MMSNASECRDDLVSRLQRGEAAAFAALVGDLDGALRRTARTLVSTPACADEVVQDTWLAVLHGVRSFQGRSSLRTWIFGILINRARSAGVREARMVPLDDTSREPARDATPNQRLLDKELGAALEAAIAGLPERQRAIVVLRDALGWSSEDVQHLLAVNELNQRVILHRARSRLRARLDHFHS